VTIQPYAATSEKSYLTGRYGVDSADETSTSADAVASISSTTLAGGRLMLVNPDRDLVLTYVQPGTFSGSSNYVEGMQTGQGSLP
jgi:hypothetical protein